MKNNASLVYSFFLVIGDFLALAAAFVGAYALRVHFDNAPLAHPVHASSYLALFLVMAPFWLIVFGLLGLYNRNIYEKRFSEIGRLFVGSFVGMMFVISANYALVDPIIPAKLVPIYGFLLALVFLVVFRNLARWLRKTLFSYNIGISNILIIGNTPIAEELVESLHNSRRSGYRIVGLVSTGQHSGKHFKDIPVFKTFEQAVKTLHTDRIHSMVQTELYADSDENNHVLTFAQEHHIAYRFIPGNSELFVGNIEVDLFRSSVPIIAVHQTPLIGWGRLVKRLFDFALALFLVIILSPIYLLVIILELFFGGRGGIFFRQTRLTRFDSEFRVFKFRTMKKAYSNGETPEESFTKMGRPELIKQYRDNGDFLKKDPRVTRLGRFLRTTSLDELPQLFNVLGGDLSLVGPRALIPQELSLYAKRHAILSVKSGITGLAQVSGRKNISFEERRKLDMYYVQNWTFWMDIVILLKTFRVIINLGGS